MLPIEFEDVVRLYKSYTFRVRDGQRFEMVMFIADILEIIWLESGAAKFGDRFMAHAVSEFTYDPVFVSPWSKEPGLSEHRELVLPMALRQRQYRALDTLLPTETTNKIMEILYAANLGLYKIYSLSPDDFRELDITEAFNFCFSRFHRCICQCSEFVNKYAADSSLKDNAVFDLIAKDMLWYLVNGDDYARFASDGYTSQLPFYLQKAFAVYKQSKKEKRAAAKQKKERTRGAVSCVMEAIKRENDV